MAKAIHIGWILHKSTSKTLTEENCAAYRCSKYSTASTKQGEWFLPSKDELDLMYKNQKEKVRSTREGDWHWSSSEYSYYNAWYQHFGNNEWYNEFRKKHYRSGYQEDISKGEDYSVRGVRAF